LEQTLHRGGVARHGVENANTPAVGRQQGNAIKSHHRHGRGPVGELTLHQCGRDIAEVTHSVVVVARDQPGLHQDGYSIGTREPTDLLRAKAVLKYEAGVGVGAFVPALMALGVLKPSASKVAAAAAEMTSEGAHFKHRCKGQKTETEMVRKAG
jgi:hypothetical protein